MTPPPPNKVSLVPPCVITLSGPLKSSQVPVCLSELTEHAALHAPRLHVWMTLVSKMILARLVEHTQVCPQKLLN